jgi:hypothetical protein
VVSASTVLQRGSDGIGATTQITVGRRGCMHVRGTGGTAWDTRPA